MSTPEVVWTRLNHEQADAWHMGRQWLLLYQSRAENGKPVGWYLHGTLGAGALADHGRWMGRRFTSAQEKATALLLSPQGRKMADAAEHAAEIAE